MDSDILPHRESRMIRSIRNLLVSGNITPLLILTILCVVWAFMQPAFLSAYNALTILTSLSTLLILAVGMTFIILAGRVDLSTGGVVSFCSVVVAMLFPYLGLWAILLGILVGAAFGFLNGIIHQYLKIPSFISTFGVGGIAFGLAYATCSGQPVAVPHECLPYRMFIIGKSIIGLSNIHFIAIFITVFGFIVLKYTQLGRYIYVMGYQEKVAKLSGVRITRSVILIFGFYGICSGIAGGLLTSLLAIGSPNVGDPYTLQAIAAVIVGGTAITGGSGSIFRTVVGSAIITVLLNGMNIAAINPYVRQLVLGAAIIVVVAFTLDRSKVSVVK